MKHLLYSMTIVLLLCSCTVARAQKFEHLADTPAMGWNSWNKFTDYINEDIVKGTIDAMVTTGLRDVGYVYINIDDSWHGERDEQGFIQSSPKKFPSGIKFLADYAHAKGLKLGIYSDAGYKTCANYSGSLGHEYQDALQYAKWGIDYLKEDFCYAENINPVGAYTLMCNALQAAGRPVYFSICEGGYNKPWEWAKDISHSWRTTIDIQNNFKSVLSIIDQQEGLRKYAGPGRWNDPDMLEVGNGMSVNEDRAHFTMWCMLAAPLILGNDIRSMSKETVDILMNKEVIALDQDKLGIEALKFSSEIGLEFWFKPLENGDWAFCILNRNTTPEKYIINWKKFNLNDDLSQRSINFDTAVYNLQNLWTKKSEGSTRRQKKVTVPGHDVLVWRLSIKK
jgi:alpha-galactosidase